MTVEVVAHTYRVPMLDTFEQDDAFPEALSRKLDVQDCQLAIDGHWYVTIYSGLAIASHASQISIVRNEVLSNVR